jgi:hypothetical protein
LFRAAHDSFQRIKLLALLIDQQLRVANNIDEQNMPDLKLNF